MDIERFSRDEQNRRARELRRKMTPEEVLLWNRLRAGQLGVAFRKQQPLGFYFADFVCFEKKLVIELDGSHFAFCDSGITKSGTTSKVFSNESRKQWPSSSPLAGEVGRGVSAAG
ncbi:endonuclease domain-containing protein [Deinococcus xinjiangensis]|uniref:endonuclease domain-containing protein n=1 Tax=Deinococcus xinjiangensis TaxID=457454 RepID=UPI003EB8BC00